jgi:hypothetical protein
MLFQFHQINKPLKIILHFFPKARETSWWSLVSFFNFFCFVCFLQNTCDMCTSYCRHACIFHSCTCHWLAALCSFVGLIPTQTRMQILLTHRAGKRRRTWAPRGGRGEKNPQLKRELAAVTMGSHVSSFDSKLATHYMYMCHHMHTTMTRGLNNSLMWNMYRCYFTDDNHNATVASLASKWMITIMQSWQP